MTAVYSVEYTVHYVAGSVEVHRDGDCVNSWEPMRGFGTSYIGIPNPSSTRRLADACAREYAKHAPSDAWEAKS